MHIVVADHKLVLVTDMEDVAWDTAKEMMEDNEWVEAECEHAYCEELDEQVIIKNGTYKTLEGDVITLEEYNNAEHAMR